MLYFTVNFKTVLFHTQVDIYFRNLYLSKKKLNWNLENYDL